MNTTVKSGNSIFAPDWDMVLGLKAWQKGQGGIDEEEYKRLYHAKMNQSWKEKRGEWLAVIESSEPMALGCYCRAGDFCHRYLLKDIFAKLCEARGIPFFYYGELLPDRQGE